MTNFRFQYVGIWYLIGFGFGLVLGVGNLLSEGFSFFGTAILMALIAFPLGFIIWGFIGLAIATLTNGFKFNNLVYRKWIWYIYPIYTIYALTFGLVLGFLKVLTGK